MISVRPLVLRLGGKPHAFHLSFGSMIIAFLPALALDHDKWGPLGIVLGLVLGVFCHEWGHALAARLSRVRVRSFHFRFLTAHVRLRPEDIKDASTVRFIGLAGPVANLLLVLVAFAFMGNDPGRDPFWEAFGLINAYFAIFNLLPIGTLDGALVLYGTLREDYHVTKKAARAFRFVTGSSEFDEKPTPRAA